MPKTFLQTHTACLLNSAGIIRFPGILPLIWSHDWESDFMAVEINQLEPEKTSNL